MILRRSNVQRYLNCRKLYWATEDGECQPAMSRPALVGIHTHGCIAEYLRHLKTTGKASDWSHMNAIAARPDMLPAAYDTEVRSFLEDFRHRAFGPATFDLIEPDPPLIINLDRKGEIKLLFQPDLTTFLADDQGKVISRTVVDWKTGHKTWTDLQLFDLDHPAGFQARWYAFCYWRLRRGDVETMGYRTEFLRMGGATAEVAFDFHQMMEFYRLMVKIAAEIEARSETEPRGYCVECPTCPIIGACPLLETTELIEVPTTQEDAFALAHSVRATAAWLTEETKLLRDYHDATGEPIPCGNNQEFRRHQIDGTTYDWAGLYRALVADGVEDADTIIGGDKKALARLVKADAGVAETAARFVRVVAKSRFEAVTVEDEQ